MDRVEIDPLGLSSSVAQTTAAAAGMAHGLSGVRHRTPAIFDRLARLRGAAQYCDAAG